MKDGGPAFPRGPFKYGHDGRILYEREDQTHPGMSLRDYFAAATLTGFMETYQAPDAPYTTEQKASVAELCYGMADAMIAEREKKA